MFKCMGCGSVFEKPVYYSEDTKEPLPYGVRWKGCPDCKDDDFYWIECCSICRKVIREEDIHIDPNTGEYVCEKCCTSEIVSDDE